MSCDDARIESFLHGDLSAADEQVFDEHLLTCESCWSAVQEDRAGRRAVEQLRVAAPLGLADRIAAAVDLAGRQPADDGSARRRHGRGRRRAGRARPSPSRRLLVATAAVVALVGSGLGWALSGQPGGDPPQIAKVAAMAAPAMANSPALRSGEHVDFGGQSLDVRSYRVEGVTAVVATSTSPFPMPASSHLVTGSSPTAWMATHAGLAMYGVNRPAGGGRESMFLVAAMPMARLPQIAALLHLI